MNLFMFTIDGVGILYIHFLKTQDLIHCSEILRVGETRCNESSDL